MSFLYPDTLPYHMGNEVAVFSEKILQTRDKIKERSIVYRKDGRFFFYRDRGEFGEEIQNEGRPIENNELFVPYQPSMLLCTDYATTAYWLKMPGVEHYFPQTALAKDGFAHELSIYEQLREHPHPGICEYKGCVVVDGYVQAIALKLHQCDLVEGVEQGLPFDATGIFNRVEAAVTHLHSLGLAHNDLNPNNILLDVNYNAVIIDLETCLPEGCLPILKYGTPGWSGNWTHSAFKNDRVALERIQLYLKGKYNPESEQMDPKL